MSSSEMMAQTSSHRATGNQPVRPAFSLLEMMIAIVILGLGLVMVATMFPVAWSRARKLNEHTVERSVAPGAEATLRALLRPAGLDIAAPEGGGELKLRLSSGSLAGDLFYDPAVLAGAASFGRSDHAVLAYSDTRVHALNLENLLADAAVTAPPEPENPWELEEVFDFVEDGNYPDPAYPHVPVDGFRSRSFLSPQVRFQDRIHPPLNPLPTAPPHEASDLPALQAQWTEQLAKRRFAWAILHRLREPVGPEAPRVDPPPNPVQIAEEAAAAMGETRMFDVYYVTLRRPNPTNRYARQATRAPNEPPDPTDLTGPPVDPAALPAESDVMLPVPWRVQVQFPASLASTTATVPGFEPTGIPTEIEVPATEFPGSDQAAALLVQMFPRGARFVDEITGAVYRVAKRRVTGDFGERAYLTLDREITLEDIAAVDPAAPAATPHELLRTVWVFPPPVDRTVSGAVPVLAGSTPVVNINVRTLSLAPSP